MRAGCSELSCENSSVSRCTRVERIVPTNASSTLMSTPGRTRVIAGLLTGDRGLRRFSIFFYREYGVGRLVRSTSRALSVWDTLRGYVGMKSEAKLSPSLFASLNASPRALDIVGERQI